MNKLFEVLLIFKIISGVSDDDAASADGLLVSPRESYRSSKLPPRPPSSSAGASKSPRPFTPIHELTGTGSSIHGAKSPSTSGHHSAGSKFSVVSSPSASPSSMGKCSSPTGTGNIDQQLQICTISPPNSNSSYKNFNRSEEAILKLRKEITALRERFANRQKDWAEVCVQKKNLDPLIKSTYRVHIFLPLMIISWSIYYYLGTKYAAR